VDQSSGFKNVETKIIIFILDYWDRKKKSLLKT